MKRRIFALFLVLAALGVTLGGRVLSSPWLKGFIRQQLTAFAHDQLGVALTVGEVDHDFLLTSLSLYDVTITDLTGKRGRDLTARRLEAKVDPFSPLRGRLAFREVRIEGLSLAVERGEDGRLVVEPLRSFWQGKEEGGAGLSAHVDSFSLLDASLVFRDPGLGVEGDLEGVTVTLGRRFLDPEGRFRVTLGARSGKVSWRSLPQGKPQPVRSLHGRLVYSPREVEVESLDLDAGPFALALKGTLPLQGDALRGSASLRFEAADLPWNTGIAGLVRVEGTVTGDIAAPVLRGVLRCPALDLSGGTRFTDIAADLDLDARRGALKNISAVFRGETLRGEAEVGFVDGLPFRARAVLADYPLDKVLAYAGLDEGAVEGALTARAEAAGLLVPARGSAGGPGERQGDEGDRGISLTLEGTGALTIDAASKARRHFTVDAGGAWRGETFSLMHGRVSSGAFALAVSGTASAGGPRLSFTLRDPALYRWAASAGWNRGLGGDLGIDGSLAGTWEAFAGKAEIRWDRPEWGGMRADLLQAHLDADPRSLRCPLASVRAGRTTATLSAVIPWKGKTEAGRVSASLSAGRLEDLLSALGSRLAGEGELSGTFEGAATGGEWSGRGILSGKELVLEEEKADSVRLPFRLEGGRVVLEPSVIEKEGRALAVEGTLGKGEFDLALQTLQPFPLDRLAVFPRIKAPLGGEVEMRARARGALSSLGESSVDAEVTSRALTYEGKSWRGVKAAFRIRRKNLAVEGTLFDGKVLGRVSLGLVGALPFRGDLTARGMSSVELDDFLVLGIPAEVSGRLDASTNAEGLLSDTQTTRASGTIEKAEVRVGDLALAAIEPIAFTYHPPEGASFTGLAVRTGQSVLRGTVHLRRGGGLAGSIKGEIDLGGIPFLAPTVTGFAGKCRVEIATGGTVDAPRLEGYADLAEVSCTAHLPFPLACRNLAGRIEVLRDRLRFGAIRGEAGGGLVEMTGDLFFSGLAPVRGQLTWNAEGVKASYPRELSVTGRASISLIFTGGRGTVRGTILADESRYDNPVDLENLIGLIGEAARGRRTGESAAGGTGGGEGVEGKEGEWLVLDLAMETVNPLEADLKILRGSAVGALRLQGPAGRPVLSGRLDVSPATIEYRGHVFGVTRGWVGFFNPRVIEPSYDIRGRTTVSGLDADGKFRDYLVDLSVTGTPAKTELTLYSDPPLGRLDILALLTWGSVTSRILEGGEGISTVGATLLLTSQLKGRIESGVQKLIGFDRFVINPVQASASGQRDMWVQVDKSLGERLYLTYSTPVGATGDHEVELRYRVTDIFSILGSQKGENEVGLDLDFSFEIP